MTPGRRQRAKLGHFGGGEHQPHALHGAHPRQIADVEARMRVLGPQHHRVQRGFGRNIGHVTPLPAQQRVVLFARERLADPEFHRRFVRVPAAGSFVSPRRPAVRNAIQREIT